ncbi:MAG: replicative DNA helicase [Nitrosopumilus sp.]
MTVAPQTSVVNPPYSRDLEKLAFQHIFIDPAILTKLLGGDFLDEGHRKLFETCSAVYRVSGKCTMVTVNEELRGQDWYEKLGGSVYLAETNYRDLGWEGEEKLIELLRDLHVMRLAKELKLPKEKAKETIAHLIQTAEQYSSLLPDEKQSILDTLKEKREEKKIPLGFLCLDQFLGGGVSPGQVLVVGARTGIGKTALLCNIVCNMALSGERVVYVSLEMSPSEILQRFVMYLSGGKYEESDPEGELKKLGEDNVEFATNIMTIGDVEALLSHSTANVCFLDYLQLLKGDRRFEGRVQELEDITGRLKRAARRYDKAIICAAQLNRTVDTAKREPVLSDLRSSGSIEQDADIVILLHREEVSEGKKKDWEEGKTPEKAWREFEGLGNTKCLVRKNRMGPTGDAYLDFVPEIASFKGNVGPFPKKSVAGGDSKGQNSAPGLRLSDL